MSVPNAIKKTATIAAAIAALAVILAGMSGAFRKKIAPQENSPESRTLGTEATDVVHRIAQAGQAEVAGTLRAVRRTEVSPRIMAGILEMNARAGQTVQKGDVLARLDDRDLRAQLEQARQAENAAQAALAKAKKDYDRFKSLVETNVVSPEEFDQRETAYRIAQAEVQQVSQARSGAETMLSYAVIRAPSGGTVVDKLADAGDTATPGRPLLVLYDPSALRLEAAVPEALAAGLKVGDMLTMKIDTAASPDPVEGPIEEIVPQAQAASRSVLVKVRLPQVGEGMVDGAYGRLLIPGRERVRLCLALSAVRRAGQLAFVDVVGEGGALERRMVTLGEHSRLGRVEVLSGLDVGERVVLHGPPPEPLPPGTNLFGEEGGAE